MLRPVIDMGADGEHKSRRLCLRRHGLKNRPLKRSPEPRTAAPCQHPTAQQRAGRAASARSRPACTSPGPRRSHSPPARRRPGPPRCRQRPGWRSAGHCRATGPRRFSACRGRLGPHHQRRHLRAHRAHDELRVLGGDRPRPARPGCDVVPVHGQLPERQGGEASRCRSILAVPRIPSVDRPPPRASEAVVPPWLSPPSAVPRRCRQPWRWWRRLRLPTESESRPRCIGRGSAHACPRRSPR